MKPRNPRSSEEVEAIAHDLYQWLRKHVETQPGALAVLGATTVALLSDERLATAYLSDMVKAIDGKFQGGEQCSKH
jgi:hypothetical protein